MYQFNSCNAWSQGQREGKVGAREKTFSVEGHSRVKPMPGAANGPRSSKCSLPKLTVRARHRNIFNVGIAI